MDPRFKIKHVDDLEKMKNLVETESLQIHHSSPPSSSASYLLNHLKKRRKTLGTFVKPTDGDNSSTTGLTISPEQKISLEISTYLSSPTIDSEEDPLEWWKIRESTTLHMLSRLANKYLSIPATSSASERLFSCSGNIVTPARNSLKPDMVDQLTFLACNVELPEPI